LFLGLTISPCYARGLAKLPTQEQLNKYCVALRLTIDGQLHWFVYKQLEFDSGGVTVSYGKKLEKKYYLLKEQILNFDETLYEWLRVKLENQ